jgi:hypothetical protein
MRRRRPLILGSAVAAAVFSLLAAGCGGGGGSPGVASVASSTTTATTSGPQNGLGAYAACMRSHGVPTFPDPDSSGGIPKIEVVNARSADPSRFDAADGACRHLLPASGSLAAPETAQQRRTQLADELSFAHCMRSHGLARFPDPSAQGQLSVEMVQAQGIDVHSPAVLRIVQACLPASHGALTPAKVREALNNADG